MVLFYFGQLEQLEHLMDQRFHPAKNKSSKLILLKHAHFD